MAWPTPIQLIQQRRRPRRVYYRPYWTRAWFWWTGAFMFALMFWCVVFELWLVYAMVWAMVEGIRWAVTMAIARPAGAVRSRRDDKLHKARQTEGDW